MNAGRGVPLVVVGGVPGAGKSVLLRRLASSGTAARVLDPELVTARVRRHVGGRVPYQLVRPLIHSLHLLHALFLVTRGPGVVPLVLHDTATRPRRLALLRRLASSRGWATSLLLIDVTRHEALAGQASRGRLVPRGSFEAHWRRWQARSTRPNATYGDLWDSAQVVDREHALSALMDLLHGTCSPTARNFEVALRFSPSPPSYRPLTPISLRRSRMPTSHPSRLVSAPASPRSRQALAGPLLPTLLVVSLALSACGDDGGGGFGECTTTGATPAAASVEPTQTQESTAAVTDAVTAAEAFVSTLDGDQAEAVQFEFTDLDGKRCSWSNFPSVGFDGRQGVRLGDLSEDQRTAALAAVQSVLSEEGYQELQGIMAADDFVADRDGDDGFGSDQFWLALYGAPSAEEPWTLQFGGHHYALHVTLAGDSISTTPFFSGVEPITFEWEGTSYDPMGDDAAAVFDLLESLSDEQLTSAETSGAYDDIAMGPGVDTGYPEQEGLAVSELDDAQRDQVLEIIEQWVGDTAPAFSEPLIELYTSQLDETTIAWSGSTSPDEIAYFRLDGPRLWIEHLNAESDTGIHYHTIYRDRELDYGTGVPS